MSKDKLTFLADMSVKAPPPYPLKAVVACLKILVFVREALGMGGLKPFADMLRMIFRTAPQEKSYILGRLSSATTYRNHIDHEAKFDGLREHENKTKSL